MHFEIDVPDPKREIPVGTTGEVRIDVGEPSPASEVPIYAATVRGTKALLFVVEGDVAHAKMLPVKGEAAGRLYLDTALAPGALVVAEGRALLDEGDRVTIKLNDETPVTPTPGSSSASTKESQP